jgi:hypothetical protein
MVQHPDGSRQICSKKFPRSFQPETLVAEDGYPRYRCRNDGRTWIKKVHGQDVVLDSRWVVPYNPWLTRKYSTHINMEVCASVGAIKYVHKYIYKGADRTTLKLADEHDEIARYLNGRYISPCQAAWNLFEFRNHNEDPPVIRLALHLPNEQPVHSHDDVVDLAQVLEEAETTLTSFLRYNAESTDGRHLLYHDFPEYYVYHHKKGERRWTPRQRGRAIGRMYHCGPAQGERFYLRMLLTVIRGPTSFEAIRTVDTVLYPTFRAACIALGLLADDGEWFQCFDESKHFATGRALRSLFVTALINGDLSEPVKLWERFRADICDDLPRRIARDYPSVPADSLDAHLDYGLFLIAEQL